MKQGSQSGWNWAFVGLGFCSSTSKLRNLNNYQCCDLMTMRLQTMSSERFRRYLVESLLFLGVLSCMGANAMTVLQMN